MKSVFLSTVGIMIVCMGVPVSLFIYKEIFGITYFSNIHVSVIVIIIGIGADDIFVFHDAWLRSRKISSIKSDHLKILTRTMREAGLAMLMTSATSTMAFVACSVSPVMPVRAFGIFSSLVVPVVFILTLTILPFAYFVYEKFILER